MAKGPRFDVAVSEEDGVAVVSLLTDLPDEARVHAFRHREIQVAGESEVRVLLDGSGEGTVQGGRLTLRLAEEPDLLDQALALGTGMDITVLPAVSVDVTFDPRKQSSSVTAQVGGPDCSQCEGSPAAFVVGTGTDSPVTVLQVSESIAFSPPA